MDAHLMRLNQMSYQQQHLMNNRTNRSHYSQRQQQQHHLQQQQHHLQQQQQQQQQHRLQQQQHQQQHKNQQHISSAGSSGSENEEQVQLSSVSTSTNKTTSSSSQQAMLLANQNKLAMQHKRTAGQQGNSTSNRQQNLQLATGTSNRKAANTLPSIDNITTSSSSDHTLDDLHQLATSGAGHYGGASGASRLGPGMARYGGHHDNQVGDQAGSRFLLGVLFTIAELLLFATLLLWLYWAYQHDDGLAWQSERKQQFNTHAALMLAGFIFLNGQAMLIYRSFQCCTKIYTKILHTILFVLATSSISLGLILGYTAQENVGPSAKPIMHFYSLHAWCGIATVGLFVLQFVFGFVSFLVLLCCDSATSRFRQALLPIHKTFGLIIFGLATSTCLTGLLQTARSRLSSKLNKTDYHELGEAGLIINLIGVCLICLAILMPYIIRNLDIKRPFRSEFERHLKLSQLEMRM